MNIIKRIAETNFVRSAMADKADLSAFKKKPTLRVLLGVSAIGFSYVIGWPTIAALGAFSIYVGQPLLIAIGGPLLYGLSHLVFLGGMYLAGAKYTRIFFSMGNPGDHGKIDASRLFEMRPFSDSEIFCRLPVPKAGLETNSLRTIAAFTALRQKSDNG